MLGRVPEAAAHYEQALRLRPDYGLAHLNLARALVRLDRYPEAIRHYEAALRLKIGGAAAEAELGDALMHEGRAERGYCALSRGPAPHACVGARVQQSRLCPAPDRPGR